MAPMMMWMVLGLVVLTVSPVHPGIVYKAEVDESHGVWTSWFDADDPYGSQGGDMETVHEVFEAYGRNCQGQGIPCFEPVAMEVDISDLHRQRFPDSNLTEILECTHLLPDAKDSIRGFYCLNSFQTQAPPHLWCLDKCKKNGQHDIYQTHVDPNCFRCANFKVRYFCFRDQLIPCNNG